MDGIRYNGLWYTVFLLIIISGEYLVSG